jgi:hypothetical protein
VAKTTYFSCLRTARTRASAHVRARAWLSFLNASSPNLEGTFYGSWHVAWAIYCVCVHATRACVLSARVCVHSLIFERIMSKFSGNILRLTISGKDYVLFMFTHRAHAWKRACASARVIKRSQRIFSKFGGMLLWVMTRGVGYICCVCTQRARTCVLGARVCVHSLIFERIMSTLLGTYYDSP